MNNSKIKVAVLGIGNCASSLVQGLEYYKINDTENGLISDEAKVEILSIWQDIKNAFENNEFPATKKCTL